MAISAKYQKYLNSDKWRRKRNDILRCHRLCQICHHRRATQVHHKTYARIFQERLSDLQAVCGQCHMEFHGIEDGSKKVKLFGGFKKIWARVIG